MRVRIGYRAERGGVEQAWVIAAASVDAAEALLRARATVYSIVRVSIQCEAFTRNGVGHQCQRFGGDTFCSAHKVTTMAPADKQELVSFRLSPRAQEIVGSDDQLSYPGMNELAAGRFHAPAETVSRLIYDLRDQADRNGTGYNSTADERALCRRAAASLEKVLAR